MDVFEAGGTGWAGMGLAAASPSHGVGVVSTSEPSAAGVGECASCVEEGDMVCRLGSGVILGGQGGREEDIGCCRDHCREGGGRPGCW